MALLLPALSGMPLALLLPALSGMPLALLLPALSGMPLALVLPALSGLPLVLHALSSTPLAFGTQELRLFQNPGVDMLVRYCRPAPHVVVGKVLREHRFRHRQTINQTGTACKLATSQALSKVDPATSFSRTPTNLPILLARQNQIKPSLFHNQRILG